MKFTKQILIALFAACALLLTACSEDADLHTINKLSDLDGKDIKIAQPSDYNLTESISKYCPNAQIQYIDTAPMGLSAVSTGKIDAFMVGESYFDTAVKEGTADKLTTLDEPFQIFKLGVALNSKTPLDDYINRVNQIIDKYINDGTFAEMDKRWLVDGCEDMPTLTPPANPERTLKIATYGLAKPYSFYINNELRGFDVELAQRIAYELNCDVVFETTEYPSMLLGLSTNKYDMVSANMYITDDREENVVFSDSYDQIKIVAVVRDNQNTNGSGGALANFKSSFRKTFITDNRWMTLLSGLKTTAVITVFGFILANIFGALYCALCMSTKKSAQTLADIYSRIMQGTPIVVILLILFYVIFGNSQVSGVTIAILGFALDSGVAIGQLFYGGITGVPKGQKEAALALGFTPVKTYIGIIFPQAMRRIITGYFSAFINLMKGSSIVGYVAVIDLTKAGNIIQSNTYEAFFPLITVAVVYFLISTLLLELAKRIQKRLEPKRITGKEAGK